MHNFWLCRKINRQRNRQTNKPLSFYCVHKPGGTNNFSSWSGYCFEICKDLSPIVHLCGKINRQTNRQTNKHLSLDCVDKPRGLALKVPSLARSVPKPLSIFVAASFTLRCRPPTALVVKWKVKSEKSEVKWSEVIFGSLICMKLLYVIGGVLT